MRKYFFAIFIFFSMVCLFGSTYKWAPRYNIKNIKAIALGKNIKNFYDSHSDNKVWYEAKFPTLVEGKSTVLKSGFTHNAQGTQRYSINVWFYLEDVDAIISFSAPLKRDERKIYLYSYTKKFSIKDGKKVFSLADATRFDDFNKTAETEEIKKSFEKNVLDKLDIDWKYEKESILDKLYVKIFN